MNVGDRLLSVNDVSLIGKDRHVTVDLVKKCGNFVYLKIFRWVFFFLNSHDFPF